MYLGVPSLTIIKLREAIEDLAANNDSLKNGEIYFRNWYNGKKGVGK